MYVISQIQSFPLIPYFKFVTYDRVKNCKTFTFVNNVAARFRLKASNRGLFQGLWTPKYTALHFSLFLPSLKLTNSESPKSTENTRDPPLFISHTLKFFICLLKQVKVEKIDKSSVKLKMLKGPVSSAVHKCYDN